ncbi:MAG TPA: hypothetical protein DF296_00620 [Candidatus Margulisbacteria bacterium]|nr:MAG: hypothetical protein A2X09_17510 [Bacteroidetes bacterium GWF2_43_11]OGI11317.1 MAG: hypothetical protein A2X41_04325 [Candidatus Margulisbacteria bacterium GWE2_39_32]HCT83686.1 hypothetical protein [Candidatus Margulisiibacteriota bacterium]
MKDLYPGIGGCSAPVAVMKMFYTYDFISEEMLLKIGNWREADVDQLSALINNQNPTQNNLLFLQDPGY